MDIETMKCNCLIAQNEVYNAHHQADWFRKQGWLILAVEWQRKAAKWHRQVWFWMDMLAGRIDHA